jgi:hypothetical protein
LELGELGVEEGAKGVTGPEMGRVGDVLGRFSDVNFPVVYDSDFVCLVLV